MIHRRSVISNFPNPFLNKFGLSRPPRPVPYATISSARSHAQLMRPHSSPSPILISVPGHSRTAGNAIPRREGVGRGGAALHINAGTMQKPIFTRGFLAILLVLCSCGLQWPTGGFTVSRARSTSRNARFDGVVLPTHSNFLKSQYFRPRRAQYVWCARNASVCIDKEKNPWGGSTCCWNKFCKDTSHDSNHCGSCGNACGYGLSCCGGRCVDVNNNRSHCGSCGGRCPGDQRCSFGMCGYGVG